MAANRGGNAPAWLFSFVDLAFLMLIAMTQVASRASGPELGEVLVPRLNTEASEELPTNAKARWQLRVHPPETDVDPFQLVRAADASAPSNGELRLSDEALRTRLAALHATGEEKPLLAPHRDSRSEDLLEAAGLLEESWPRRRRATMVPIFAGR